VGLSAGVINFSPDFRSRISFLRPAYGCY
jgi:hypothetical protein